MKISSSMICWNEEMTIDLALKSIADFVDEVVIVDTGSFDNTLKVAQETMDNLNLSGQIKQIKITKLRDARLEAYHLCENNWVLMQDSNLVLSNALKKAMKRHMKWRPNRVGAVRSLNLMGDYDHCFRNLPFMDHHKIFVNKEVAQWGFNEDRPIFLGRRVMYRPWAVNISRLRPAWRYWIRGEPFSKQYYDTNRKNPLGHKHSANFQYMWQKEDKYYSIIEYIKATQNITLNDIKAIAPNWLLDLLKTETKPLTYLQKRWLPDVLKEERKDPRYKLIYTNKEIIDRWPEL